jgi:hypothetical protein
MASTADQPSAAPQSTPLPAGSGSRPQSRSEALSSSPVEMRTLQASGAAHESTNTTGTTASAPIAIAAFTPNVLPPKDLESAQLEPALGGPKPPTTLNRAETEAIGPSTDTPAAMPDNTNGPVLVIMLLLTSGARHTYKIEKKYLQKRKVDVEDWDPYKISVYTLKELIWRDWREGTHDFIHVMHKSRRVKYRRACRFTSYYTQCYAGIHGSSPGTKQYDPDS